MANHKLSAAIFTLFVVFFPLTTEAHASFSHIDRSGSGLTATPHETIQAAPTAAPTLPAALSPTPAASTDTNGTFIAGVIIWSVIAMVVAVTAFLVWRTRPRK